MGVRGKLISPDIYIMRHLSILHKKAHPLHLGRAKGSVHRVMGAGGLVSRTKKFTPEQYDMVSESIERLGGGLKHKKFKPLKFKF